MAIQLLPVLLPGLLIAIRGPRGFEELDYISAGLVIVEAAVVVLFHSPVNKTLLLPGNGRKPGGIGLLPLVLSLVLFPALFLVAWALLADLTGNRGISALAPGPLAFGKTLLLAFSFNLVLGGSLGEEIGWRGFFLPALLERKSPLSASLVLGVVWALWHIPIDLAGGFGVAGPGAILARLVWTIPISIIFTWLYRLSNGNLLVAFFLHTSLNVLPALGFSGLRNAMAVLTLLNLVLASAIVVTWAHRGGTGPVTGSGKESETPT